MKVHQKIWDMFIQHNKRQAEADAVEGIYNKTFTDEEKYWLDQINRMYLDHRLPYDHMVAMSQVVIDGARARYGDKR